MLTGIIDDIRRQIGRGVEFYIPTLSGCTVCTLDPYTNTSTDSLCSGCAGEYWVTTYNPTTISGHITWGSSDLMNWQTGGQLFEGDCRIQIKYTEGNLQVVESSEYLVADGKKLEIKSKILRGVPTLNRVILDCIEKEKTG